MTTPTNPSPMAKTEQEGPTDFDEPGTGAVRHLRKAFGPGPANGESYVATAEDITRCLAANPQLRASVLSAALRSVCDSDFDEYLRLLPSLAPSSEERRLAGLTAKLKVAESALAAERARVVAAEAMVEAFHSLKRAWYDNNIGQAEFLEFCEDFDWNEPPALPCPLYEDPSQQPSPPAEPQQDSAPSPGAPDAPVDSGAEKPREATGALLVAPDSPRDGGGATAEPQQQGERVTHEEALGFLSIMSRFPGSQRKMGRYVAQAATTESELRRKLEDAEDSSERHAGLAADHFVKLGATKAKLQAAEAELQRQSNEWAHLLEAAAILRLAPGFEAVERHHAWLDADDQKRAAATEGQAAPAQQDSISGPAAAAGGVFAGSEAAGKEGPTGVAPSRGDSGRLRAEQAAPAAVELPGGKGPDYVTRAGLAAALRKLAMCRDADTAPRHIAWQNLANELEAKGE